MSTDGINPMQTQPLVAEEIVSNVSEPPAAESAENPSAVAGNPESQAVGQALQDGTRVEGELDREEDQLTKQQAEEISSVLNEIAKINDIALQFEVDEEINRVIITVMERETEEVIRQIPPEEVIAISKRIGEMVGLLFNAEV